MATTDEVLTALGRGRRTVNALLGEQERALAERWVNLWGELSTELSDSLQEPLRRRRVVALQRATTLVQQQLTDLAPDVARVLSVDLPTAAAAGAEAQLAATRASLPAGVGITLERVPEAAMSAIVTRATQRVHSASRPLTEQMAISMKLEIEKGVALGDNPRRVARQIMKRTQGRFNGGLGRALTLARTEMLDAHRVASAAANLANKDVVTGWRWMATLSGRTCSACLSMNGSAHELTEPGPLGHQNCRCVRVPTTKTWADLGFKGIPEPPDQFPDAEAWFNNLTVSSQKEILGLARYTSWAAGDYPMSKWATRQENPGWRPSYVRSKP